MIHKNWAELIKPSGGAAQTLRQDIENARSGDGALAAIVREAL